MTADTSRRHVLPPEGHRHSNDAVVDAQVPQARAERQPIGACPNDEDVNWSIEHREETSPVEQYTCDRY